MRRSDGPLTQRLRARAAGDRARASTTAAEARYVRDVRGVLRGVHEAFMAYFDPRLAEVAQKRDAITRASLDLAGLEVHVLRQIPEKLGPLFDRMAHKVNRANASTQAALLGIDPAKGEPRIAGAIAAARDANIRLVENAGRAYAAQVREVFDDPNNYGLSVDELKAALLERGDVSVSRAELIARDQTLKLNGALTQTRQTNAGVTSYVWSTSKDERVRDTHQEKEGETFDWNSPPPDTGHPGDDYQCRCVAVPVVPELEGL